MSDERAQTAEHEPACELAANQQLIWLGQQQHPHIPLYEVPYRFEIEGDVDTDIFVEAFRHLVDENPILRTVASDEYWTQTSRAKNCPSETAVVDLSANDNTTDATNEFVAEWLKRKLQPTHCLYDSVLLKTSERTYVWLIRIHHCLTDASNAGVILKSLASWYQFLMGESDRPKTHLYCESVSSVARLPNRMAAADRAWWNDRSLPAAHVPNSGEHGVRHNRVVVTLDSYESDLLGDLTSKPPFQQITPAYSRFVAMMTALAVWAKRTHDQETFHVGATSHGRSNTKLRQTVGLFMQLLPFRIEMADDETIESLVQKIVAESAGFLKHSSPGAMTAENQNTFNVVLNLIDMSTSDFAGHPTSVRWLYNGYGDPGIHLSISVLDDPAAGRPQLLFDFRSDLFGPLEQESIIARFRTALAKITQDPTTLIGDLELLSGADQSLLSDTMGTATTPAPSNVWERFTNVTQVFSGRTAIRCDATADTYSYGALHQSALQLADEIRQQLKSTVIPVLCRRDANALVGILGVLAADRCFLPIDCDEPDGRIESLIADCGADGYVDARETCSLRHVSLQTSDLEFQSDAQKACYVLYTSGSTGTPNGVIVPHEAVMNLLSGFESVAPLRPSDDIPQCSWWTNVAFDVSIYEIFSALLFGRSLNIPDAETRVDATSFFRWLGGRKITSAYLPPFWLADIDRHLTENTLPALERLLVGVEPIPQSLLASIAQRIPGLNLINGYGPTEATVCATLMRIDPSDHSDAPASIGRPVAGNQLRIVDSQGRVRAPGKVGELQITGAGLAVGYLNRAELTEERFLVDQLTGTRWYQTGDLVQLQEDGNLRFVGRMDDQVKIHGHRIEPGEIISAVHAATSKVKDIAVLEFNDNGRKSLIAAIVSDHSVDDLQLHARLLTRLPRQLVPSYFVQLETLPRTRNGKVDFDGLERIITEKRTRQAEKKHEEFVPRNATELILKDSWLNAFNTTTAYAEDNFFELGGDSLKAQQFVLELQRNGLDASVQMVFASPVLGELASLICKGSAQLQCETVERFPLSNSQKEIWTAGQLNPGDKSYHLQVRLDVPASIDTSRAKHAFEKVVQHHEMLRATVEEENGNPTFVISDDCEIQFRELFVDQTHATAQELLTEEGLRAFDMQTGPLIRFAFVRDESGCTLAITAHHLIVDQESIGILVKEFEQFYSGDTSPGCAPNPFSDFATSSGRSARRADEELQSKLESCDDEIALPYTGKKLRQQKQVANLEFQITPELSLQIKESARQFGVAPSVWLLSAFQTMLHRYSGSTAFATAVPVSQRRKQDSQTVGYFLRTARLPCDFEENQIFSALVEKTGETFAQTLSGESFPSQNAPVQVMFVSQNELPSVYLDGSACDLQVADLGNAKFDLTLFVHDTNAFHFLLEYGENFDGNAADRIRRHWVSLLKELVDDEKPISRLSFLTREDQLAHAKLAGDASDFADVTVLELIGRHAQTASTATAIVSADCNLSYGDLDLRSSKIAHGLIAHGVCPGDSIVILCERNAETIVAILGVLKAGCAYVPLDANQGESRLASLVDDVQAKVVVSLAGQAPVSTDALQVSLEKLCQYDCSEDDSLPEVALEAGAYIIFTSGSSGKPKGVSVSHRGLSYSTQARFEFYDRSPERFMLMSPAWFDSSVAGIFWTLATGGALVIPGTDDLQDVERLASRIAEHNVTDMLCLPSFYELMLRHAPKDHLRSLYRVIVAGESLSQTTVSRHYEMQPQARLFNEYGPTEATVWATAHEIVHNERDNEVTIGRSVGGVNVQLLDASMQPVPIGVRGEIFIGGERLASGYHGRMDLTRESFIADPSDSSSVLYRTGDCAFLREDGTLVFDGRLDQQLKINGHRIEPAEIESILRDLPNVIDIAVGMSPILDSDSLAQELKQIPAAVAEQLLREVETKEQLEDSLQLIEDDLAITLEFDQQNLIPTPRDRQRTWMVDQLLKETRDNLKSLGSIAGRMIPGSEQPHLPKDLFREALPEQEIMEDWQTPLMQAMADWATESHGDVLEIGFGRGVSAEMIQESGVRSHTVVEVNQHSIDHYYKPWREKHANKNINLLSGRWQDCLDRLSTYDGVFFHAFPMNETEFLEYVANSVTFAEHFFETASKLLKPGGVFTYLTTEVDSLARRHQRSLFGHFSEIRMKVQPLTVPPDTKDAWWADSMIVLAAKK